MNLLFASALHAPRTILPSAYLGTVRSDVPFPAAGFELSLATGLWFSALIDPTAAAAITGGAIEADDEIYTKSNHGLETGDPVVLTSLTGGTGLTAGTTYYFNKLSANTGYLCSTLANALTETPVAVSLDGSSVVLTPVNAVTTFDLTAFTVSGGALIGVAEGSAFDQTLTGLHYVLLQEELLDTAVATVDHTLALAHNDGTNITQLGVSTHENAGPYCGRIVMEAPKALAVTTGSLRISASDVTNIRYRIFGIGIRAA